MEGYSREGYSQYCKSECGTRKKIDDIDQIDINKTQKDKQYSTIASLPVEDSGEMYADIPRGPNRGPVMKVRLMERRTEKSTALRCKPDLDRTYQDCDIE